MTNATTEVALSVPAEPTLGKKSPKTGETTTAALLMIAMLASVCGFVSVKKRA
jgi:LPXTG-motif cell wall-anchored protein